MPLSNTWVTIDETMHRKMEKICEESRSEKQFRSHYAVILLFYEKLLEVRLIANIKNIDRLPASQIPY